MISLNWVKDYVDIDAEDLDELAVKITKAGVNVEKVLKNRIENLVIGEVVDCTDHPDSDHLHVCKVNVGSETIQIVCGAPNVRKGLKVLVALPGCILPGNFEIKKGNIRGQESNGMICALFELGLEEKNEENYAKGIAELDTDLTPGTDANIYLGTDDTIYELKDGKFVPLIVYSYPKKSKTTERMRKNEAMVEFEDIMEHSTVSVCSMMLQN